MDLTANLGRVNRWWKQEKMDEGFLYKTVRSEFVDIIDLLPERRILSIIGPRRVGKSTLIFQTINHLLNEGVDPKRILFFSADDPNLFYGDVNLSTIFNDYANNVLHENINELTEKIYILIDEIHICKDWQLWLKSYYDQRLKIKFIISGSSATHLFQRSKESLLGRIESIEVLPLSFNQFCDFYIINNKVYQLNDFKKLLPNISLFENIDAYYTELKNNWWKIEQLQPYIFKVLNTFLLVGGYPEYFETNNINLWQKRLREDIIIQGLYRDIVSIYNIKNSEKLEKLLYLISANSGQDFAYKTIGDTISVDTTTVSNYLTYLSSAFLLIIMDNYSANMAKTIRKNKRIHLLDSGINNAILRINEATSELKGHLIETNVVKDIIIVANKNFWKVNYWREKTEEVDIVLDQKNSLIPIEVKWRNNITNYSGVTTFMKKFDCKQGLIITKNTLEKRDNIYLIPYWLIK